MNKINDIEPMNKYKIGVKKNIFSLPDAYIQVLDACLSSTFW